jgi:hypothetical protein
MLPSSLMDGMHTMAVELLSRIQRMILQFNVQQLHLLYKVHKTDLQWSLNYFLISIQT